MATEKSKTSLGSLELEELIRSTKGVIDSHAWTTRSGKPASPATVKTTTEVLIACVTRIWHLGFHINNPRKLRGRHIDALVENWISAGYKTGTMRNALSRLTQLGLWMGRPGLVSEKAKARAAQVSKEPTSLA